MTAERIKQSIQGGWTSIAAEMRPSSVKNAGDNLKPFYLKRDFKYIVGDKEEMRLIS